jgi:hypothetical protein
MISFGFEMIAVAASCQAIGCFAVLNTAPISEGVRCYFVNTAPENRGISRPKPTSSLLS